MMVSLSSVTSRSAHRLRFVNSKTGISFVGLSGTLLLPDTSVMGIVTFAGPEVGAGGMVEAIWGGALGCAGGECDGGAKKQRARTQRTGTEHIERLLAAQRVFCLQLGGQER